MKRYTNEAETPLKFHKLYHYLVIPYSCLAGVFALFDYAIAPFPLTAISFTLLSTVVASVILTAIIFLGFYSFSGYAWYCLIGYLFISVAEALLEICYLFLTPPYKELSQLVYWLPDLMAPPLIALYYIKRRPLFFPQEYTAPDLTESVPESSEPIRPPLAGVPQPAPQPPQPAGTPLADDQNTKVVMNFCPNCGKQLKPDYAFCPDCGTPRV